MMTTSLKLGELWMQYDNNNRWETIVILLSTANKKHSPALRQIP